MLTSTIAAMIAALITSPRTAETALAIRRIITSALVQNRRSSTSGAAWWAGAGSLGPTSGRGGTAFPPLGPPPQGPQERDRGRTSAGKGLTVSSTSNVAKPNQRLSQSCGFKYIVATIPS